MLVLSRKVNEQIIIGDQIRLTVVSIRGNQVRIGLEAPPSVSILREELVSDHGFMEQSTTDVAGVGRPANRSSVLVESGDD
jgi:carbon storage regulator CsrA